MARNSYGPAVDIQTQIPNDQISFDVDAFSAAVLSQGVRLVHYRALRCPVGMTDLDDNRRPHPHHEGCTNGYIYTKVGTITGLFVSNSKNKQLADIGFWDGSTVQVTLPTTYDSDCCDVGPLYVAPFDRFYLEEKILVPTWQLFLHNETGIDRLKYPIHNVLELVDYQGKRYHQDVDFTIFNGNIKWTGKQPTTQIDVGPGFDGTIAPIFDINALPPMGLPTPPSASNSGNVKSRGAVCAAYYVYQPYWYVGQLLHEIRVSQATNMMTGERTVQRMPQAMMLHREYIALTRDVDDTIDADAHRTVNGPASGGIGPR